MKSKKSIILASLVIIAVIVLGVVYSKMTFSHDDDKKDINLSFCYNDARTDCKNIMSVVGHPAQNWYYLHYDKTDRNPEGWYLYHIDHSRNNPLPQYYAIPNYKVIEEHIGISVFDSEPVRQLKMACYVSSASGSYTRHSCRKIFGVKSPDGNSWQANFLDDEGSKRRILVTPTDDGAGYKVVYQEVAYWDKDF